MVFKLEIDMGNTAFDEYNGIELARILREVADSISDHHLEDGAHSPLYDLNGNNVGLFFVEDEICGG